MTNPIERARKAIGKGVRYSLGCGGYHPSDELPGRPVWRIPKGGLLPKKLVFCDCSGFVAWLIGRSRSPASDFRWWLSTDSIWSDALGKHQLFRKIDVAVPGCIAVYPDYKDNVTGKKHQGHVGLVVDPDKHIVIDCSSNPPDGISEHVQEVFWSHNHNTIFCEVVANGSKESSNSHI